MKVSEKIFWYSLEVLAGCIMGALFCVTVFLLKDNGLQAKRPLEYIVSMTAIYATLIYSNCGGFPRDTHEQRKNWRMLTSVGPFLLISTLFFPK